jgi:hypothetical protein
MKTFTIHTEVWASSNEGNTYELVAGPVFTVTADSHLGATTPLVAQGFKCTLVQES